MHATETITTISHFKERLNYKSLTDQTIANLDLTGIDLSGVHLENCVFENVRLRHAVFKHAVLKNCVFHETDLAESVFDQSELEHCKFNHVQAPHLSCQGAFLTETSFYKTDLQDSCFENVTIRSCLKFEYSNLQKSRWKAKPFPTQNYSENINMILFAYSNLKGATIHAEHISLWVKGSDLRHALLSENEARLYLWFNDLRGYTLMLQSKELLKEYNTHIELHQNTFTDESLNYQLERILHLLETIENTHVENSIACWEVISNRTFRNQTFVNCGFFNVVFRNCRFQNVVFEDCRMQSQISFERCTLEKTRFLDTGRLTADFQRSVLRECFLKGMEHDFYKTIARDTIFTDCLLHNVKRSRFTRVSFNLANVERSFDDCAFENVLFENSFVEGCFNQCSLVDVLLDKCHFKYRENPMPNNNRLNGVIFRDCLLGWSPLTKLDINGDVHLLNTNAPNNMASLNHIDLDCYRFNKPAKFKAVNYPTAKAGG